MNKVLISLKIPYLEQEFDILIPENKKVGNVKNEILKIINDLYPNFFSSTDNFNFFERSTGELVKNDRYVKNYIKNGSHLILM